MSGLTTYIATTWAGQRTKLTRVPTPSEHKCAQSTTFLVGSRSPSISRLVPFVVTVPQAVLPPLSDVYIPSRTPSRVTTL